MPPHNLFYTQGDLISTKYVSKGFYMAVGASVLLLISWGTSTTWARLVRTSGGGFGSASAGGNVSVFITGPTVKQEVAMTDASRFHDTEDDSYYPLGDAQGRPAAAVHGKAAFCPECGTPLQPGTKFCGSCGAPIGSIN